jgi:hypothetical protein
MVAIRFQKGGVARDKKKLKVPMARAAAQGQAAKRKKAVGEDDGIILKELEIRPEQWDQ